MKIFYPYSEILPSEKARALQVINTARAMAGAGAKVELYACLKKTDKEILKMYGLSPCPNLNFIPAKILRDVNFMGFKISWDGIFYRDSIRHLKRKKENFIIYTRHLETASVLLKRFPHIRLFYEAHEIFSMKRHSLFAMEKFVFNNAKGVVFISRNLMEKVRTYFPLKIPAAVIPDGVNPDIIEKAKKMRIPGEVVYVGQLYPWKGVKTLVAGMKHLPGVNLTVVGGGSKKEKEEIEKLVDTLDLKDRVKLTGFLPYEEALRYMTGAKVLVLPLEDEPISRYFTSPLKLFEYMAAGIPIVASGLPTIREILSEGETALFTAPGDEMTLAASIEKFLKDDSLARKLGNNAFALSKEYSWEKRAERIMDFLRFNC